MHYRPNQIETSANPSEALLKGLAVLEAWDNQAATNSQGTMLFLRFWDTYSAAVKQPFAVAWDKQNFAQTPSGLSDATQAVQALEEAVTARFAGQEPLPRPDNWGGFVLHPTRLEFWQGRPSRLHDRLVYELQSNGQWRRFRLAP